MMESVAYCQSLNATEANNVNQRGGSLAAVGRKRPVFHADLGEFFVGLREERGWSLRGASSMAERRKLGLSYQVLFRLEHGQIKNPEPTVLEDLSSLYGLPYGEVVARFVEHRFRVTLRSAVGPDLTSQSTETTSNGSEGSFDVTVSAKDEARRVEQQYQALVAATQAIAAQLFDLAATHSADAESQAARQAESAPRRRARATRR